MPRCPRTCALTLALVWLAQPAIAATENAAYEVRFDATWSSTTHPTSFPPSPHFTGLIGGTHDSSVTFWESGQLASDGIEEMAELGSKTTLQSEIEAAISAGSGGVVVSGGGISPSPGSVTVTFIASQSHPLLSLNAMVAPSPDWFIGVTGLDLMSGGDWIQSTEIDLFVYDAGTDDGVIYDSADDDSVPPQPIALKTDSPFDNGTPVGTFTVTRLGTPGAPGLQPIGLVALAAALASIGWFMSRSRGTD